MDIHDIQLCSDYYTNNFLDQYYIITTYYNRSFILIGELENFPHLMGIPKAVYKAHGYRNPRTLYRDIHDRNPIDPNIIPHVISTTSKMYKKVLNFCNSTDLFWNNKGPIAVDFDPSKSSSRLQNVDILLTDIKTGYMLGWVSNKSVPVNDRIKIKKYCISSWMDESITSSTAQKEKYLPNQDIELLRYVFAFDNNSNLLRHKEYKYTKEDKINILECCVRNNSNLLLSKNNERQYLPLLLETGMHCTINGICY